MYHKLLISFFLLNLTLCFSQTKKSKYSWDNIVEFKFYSFEDPAKNPNAEFVLADVEKIKELLSNSKKSESYLPKGAQQFASITFSDKKTITIQILSGLPAPIRIIQKNLLEDDWYKFKDDQTGLLWLKYINELSEKVKNQELH